MPYLTVDLDALERMPEVARASGLSDGDVCLGLVRMWRRCFREKTETVERAHLAGLFGSSSQALVDALAAFGFIEMDAGGSALRVRGAERYARVSEAKKRGAEAANRARRDARICDAHATHMRRTCDAEGAHPDALTASSDQHSAEGKGKKSREPPAAAPVVEPETPPSVSSGTQGGEATKEPLQTPPQAPPLAPPPEPSSKPPRRTWVSGALDAYVEELNAAHREWTTDGVPEAVTVEQLAQTDVVAFAAYLRKTAGGKDRVPDVDTVRQRVREWLSQAGTQTREQGFLRLRDFVSWHERRKLAPKGPQVRGGSSAARPPREDVNAAWEGRKGGEVPL